MLLGALRSALSAKLRDGELKVVQAFKLQDHKTRNLRGSLAKLETRKTVLLVDNEDNRNLKLGSRNLEGVKLLTLEEKQQLRDVLAEEIEPFEGLLPPGFQYTPGMVFQTGSMVTTDREGFRLICEAAGLPFEE